MVGTLSTVVAAIAAFGLGAALIRHLYGNAYSAAVSFLVPLLLAQIILGTFHIQSSALLGIGLVRINTCVSALAVPLSVLCCIIMVRCWGIGGAAWAQVISASLYAVIQSAWGWLALTRCPKTPGTDLVLPTDRAVRL